MSVAAPPHPPPVRKSVGHDPGEALIKEAKQRARRRRWIYGGAAAVVIAVAAAAGYTTLSSSTPPPNHATPDVPTPPALPIGQGPDAASALLTSWGQFHVGYVFVYTDGRVIWHPDAGVILDSDGRVVRALPCTAEMCVVKTPDGPRPASGRGDFAIPRDPVSYVTLERRLSPHGLDLVLAGQIEPADFVIDLPPVQSDDVWAEPTARVWEPTAYVLCPFRPIGGGGVSANATDVVDELPAPVRAVLDGKQRIYDPSIGTAHWEFPGPGQGMTDCFELTAAETSTLYRMLVANGLINMGQDPIRGAQGWERVFVYGNLAFAPEPIFPHGQHVIWGG